VGVPRVDGDTVTVLVLARPDTADPTALGPELDAVVGDVDADLLYVVDSATASPESVWSTIVEARRSHRRMRAACRASTGHLPVVRPARRRPVDWLVVLDGTRSQPAGLVPGLVGTARQTHADLVVVHRTARTRSRAARRTRGTAGVRPGGTTVERLLHSLVPQGTVSSSGGGFAVRLDRVPEHAVTHGRWLPRRERSLVVAHHRVAGAVQVAGPAFTVPPRTQPRVRPRASDRLVAQGRKAAGFAGAGATGILVNSAALWAFVELLHLQLAWAAFLATQVSTLWNFLLVDRLVYRGEKNRPWYVRYLGFALVNNAVLLLRLPLLSWMTYALAVPYLIANLVTLALAFLVRFLVADRLLFRARSPHDPDPRQAAGGGGAPHAVPDADPRAARQGSPGGAGGRSPHAPVARPA
jgi:dolichol-phosphate mannosyltransferase